MTGRGKRKKKKEARKGRKEQKRGNQRPAGAEENSNSDWRAVMTVVIVVIAGDRMQLDRGFTHP